MLWYPRFPSGQEMQSTSESVLRIAASKEDRTFTSEPSALRIERADTTRDASDEPRSPSA